MKGWTHIWVPGFRALCRGPGGVWASPGIETSEGPLGALNHRASWARRGGQEEAGRVCEGRDPRQLGGALGRGSQTCAKEGVRDWEQAWGAGEPQLPSLSWPGIWAAVRGVGPRWPRGHLPQCSHEPCLAPPCTPSSSPSLQGLSLFKSHAPKTSHPQNYLPVPGVLPWGLHSPPLRVCAAPHTRARREGSSHLHTCSPRRGVRAACRL